ncbi:MAG: LLM class flavin-dependent oxidoreductase [Pseudomonadota bacterium]
MMKSKRIGYYLQPTPLTDGGFERAIWAEAEGYDDIWFPDGGGMQDAMTLAAAVAGRTSRARLATGIVPVFTRPPAVLATSTLAINQIAPGRFVLGLGSSTHAMVDGWYGGQFEKPVTRVRETVEVTRAMLAGEKSQYEGQTVRSRGFKLAQPIDGHVPIFLAAMGPKMLQLCGETADGVILNNFTPLDRLPYALEQIDIGAKRVGKRVDDIEIAQRVSVIETESPDEAEAFFRTEFSFYGSTEVYRNIITMMGYEDAARGLEEGFRVRNREQILASVPDEALRRLYVWGDRAYCHERVRAFYAAGVDTVVVAPQSPQRDDYQRTAEAFTPKTFSIS